MNKEKISNHQLYFLIACVICSSSLLTAASLVTELCGYDGWVASIVPSLFGVVLIPLYYTLDQLFPNKGLIQIIRTVFGKRLGAIISIHFIIFCVHSGIQITAYIGQFITMEYLITSSIYSISLLILIIMAGALLHGLKTTVRSPEILLKIVIFIMAFLFLANISNIRVHYTQPVPEGDFCPTFKGSLHITSYRIWPPIFLSMIYPIHTDNSSSTLKAMFKGYFLGLLIMFLMMLMSILVSGMHVTSVFVYPTYFFAKQISFGFLSHVEGLIVGAWLIALFFKGFCYFYAGVRGISTSMRLKDCRKVVCPILFVVLVYSNIVYPSSAYLAFWDRYVQIPYSFTVGFLLPTFIVIAYSTRKALQETSRPELAQDSA